MAHVKRLSKIHHQPPVKGMRRHVRGLTMLPALDNWVTREAERDGVSKSFVLANCVSAVSGLPMDARTRRRR